MKDSFSSAAATVVARHGAAIGAVVSGLVALPSLGLPFLSDDWANLASVEYGVTGKTPFNYFRPVYLASYWVERRIWGLSPSLSHLTNLCLVALIASLVVILTRRYTQDARMAALAGLLFAIHPHHVENIAWVAGRSDSMCAAFVLLGALVYDRWRETHRGIPIVALLSFEAALLSKESAIVLLAFLILLGLCDRRRRADVGEWVRGLIPMLLVALLHFFWLRPQGVKGPEIELWNAIGPPSLTRLAHYLSATLLPAQDEVFESHPRIWFGVALVVGLAILAIARRASSRIPSPVWVVASAAFVVTLGPAIFVAFQPRYFLLPSVASSVALAALLMSMRGRARAVIVVSLAAGWLVALGIQWKGWLDAGHASDTLIAGLVNASRAPNVRELVVVNAPSAIHGHPVTGDWHAAVKLCGGQSVNVLVAPAVDYASSRDTILDGPRAYAVRSSPTLVEIASVIPRRRYYRYVTPHIPPGSDRVERDYGTIELSPDGRLRVRVVQAADGTRAAFLWSEGRLERLF